MSLGSWLLRSDISVTTRASGCWPAHFNLNPPATYVGPPRCVLTDTNTVGPPSMPRENNMSIKEIAYDLRAPGRNYEPLYAAIREYGTWCHPVESTWLVVTDDSTEVVTSKLSRHLDSNDRLLVTGLTGEASWRGMSSEVQNWLQSQLGSAGRY